MRKRRKNTIAVVTFFLLLICGTAIVVFLKENTHQASKLNNQVAGQEHIAQVQSSQVDSSIPESPSTRPWKKPGQHRPSRPWLIVFEV